MKINKLLNDLRRENKRKKDLSISYLATLPIKEILLITPLKKVANTKQDKVIYGNNYNHKVYKLYPTPFNMKKIFSKFKFQRLGSNTLSPILK